RRLHLASSGFKIVHYLIDHLLESDQTRRSLFESFRDAASQFTAIEWLMRPITLHYTQIRALDFFIGRETIFTTEAFAATTNAGAVPRLSGVDHLIVT